MTKARRIFGWIAKAVKFVLAAVLVFAASLFFREQSIPRWGLDEIEKRVPGLSVSRASFGFRHGLRISALAFRDERGREIFTAASVDVGFFTRTVRVVAARYPRLPDSWYETATRPPEPVEIDWTIPDLPAFTLVLERPSILGIEPEVATARVECGDNRAVFLDTTVAMPDRDSVSRVTGRWVVDAQTGRIDGDLQGSMNPARIRPLMDALDIPVAGRYMDAFTEVRESVPAAFSLSAGIERGDVKFTLSISPRLGRYNGVPLERAEGTLVFSSRVPEGARDRKATADWQWRDNILEVELPYAIDAAGRRVAGRVRTSNETGRYVAQFDVKSGLALEDAAKISEIPDPGMLSCIKCDTPPVLTLKGRSATSEEDFALNDLKGTVKLERGSVAKFQTRDATAEWSLAGDVLEGAGRMRGKTGGRISWRVNVEFAGFSGAENSVKFSAKAKYSGGSIEEVADVLQFDPGERRGKIEAEAEISGVAGEGFKRSLNGSGRVKVHEGMLARMKLFAGLTDLLADKVAGIGALTDQSEASADFTIKDGVLYSDNIYIEGSLVSLKAWGKYDIAEDRLEFTVRVQLLRSGSIAGMLLHPLTLPFTKLLLEFRLEGSAADPKWHYIQPLERIF